MRPDNNQTVDGMISIVAFIGSVDTLGRLCCVSLLSRARAVSYFLLHENREGLQETYILTDICRLIPRESIGNERARSE